MFILKDGSEVTLNCDLDGVQVDFEAGFYDRFKISNKSIPEAEMWDMIQNNHDHWHDLPPMEDAMILWGYIRRFNPEILTGCPASGYDKADAEKRRWVVRHLGDDIKVITCRSRDKPLHMQMPRAILIDDLVKNCKRWTEAGGIAIRHTSAVDTIRQLKALGLDEEAVAA